MKKKALLLMLVLMFISTNALSQNAIFGTVSGDVQEGIEVMISRNSCGVPNPVTVLTTDSEGKYFYWGLDDGWEKFHRELCIKPHNLILICLK